MKAQEKADGQVDEKVRVQSAAAYLHRTERGLYLLRPILLEIVERHTVPFTHIVAAAGFHGAVGAVADPETLDDGNVAQTSVHRISFSLLLSPLTNAA